MLIFTRRIDESVIIGDNVKLTVLSVSRNKVRLGFKAPRDVEVHREEVYKNIQFGKHQTLHLKNDKPASDVN